MAGTSTMDNFHRIVHLDLKGAPMKVQYLEKVMYLFKTWGATGILVEWEDTFPYVDELVDIGSNNSTYFGDGLYSVSDVQYIFKVAKYYGLEVIQLIQTFGRMEFVLKYPKWSKLREVPLCPSIICPAKSGSQRLVRTMVDQALALQPDAKYIHIGGDEIWHSRTCVTCESVVTDEIASRGGSTSLYLSHVCSLASYLRQTAPSVQILMWDDVMRPVPFEVLQAYNMGSQVLPVVWDYSMEQIDMDANIWERYKTLFPSVWAASVYKGAASSHQVVVPLERYVSNQEAWVREIARYKPQIKFDGIILTGWSRFDHFATMCELLPMALPCLAVCLKTIVTNNKQIQYEAECLASMNLPGHELVALINKFSELREKCMALARGDLVHTWMNPWQLEHSYINPLQVESIAIEAQDCLEKLYELEPQLRAQFEALTGPRSTAEWIGSKLNPLQEQMQDLFDQANERASMEPGIWPMRQVVEYVEEVELEEVAEQ